MTSPFSQICIFVVYMDTILSQEAGSLVQQLVLHSSQKGWGFMSHIRSQGIELVSEEIQVQNVDHTYYRKSNQVRELVYNDRSKR